jgi:hypothetical protein
MALLGHHFFQLSAPQWASRVQGVLSGAAQPKVTGFKLLSSSAPDALACAKATGIYAGQTALTAEEFLSLSWLQCFARSGRQLLLCHALRLLQGWTGQRKPSSHILDDITVLNRLSAAAPEFAFHLNPELLQPLAGAMQQQIQKVWAAKPKSLTDYTLKADALFQASKVLQNSSLHLDEAIRLWDVSVPHLVAEDGSPTQHTLADYTAWISPLLEATDIIFAPATRQSLDRALPFLAMLVRGDGRYCFSKHQPVEAVKKAPPLRHAHIAHMAHVKAGKTSVIALSQPLNVTAQIAISVQGHHLFDASFAPAHAPLDAVFDVQQTAQGQLVLHRTPDFQRTIFLSPKGDDLRIEEQRHDKTDVLYLKLNADMRVSISRAGTQATLSLGSKNLWQLSLRGGSLAETSDATILRITMTSQCLNWALKSITRSVEKAAKIQAPELPF